MSPSVYLIYWKMSLKDTFTIKKKNQWIILFKQHT